MEYWGWRPTILLLCISVLVVACSDQDSTPTDQNPARSPEITLIIRTTQQARLDDDPALPSVITVLPNPTHITANTPGYTKSSTPVNLALQSPTCYEALSGAVLCMGVIINNRSEPIMRPVVNIQLYDRDGQLLRERIVAADRRYIAPGEAAPYRALFPSDDRPYLADDFGAAQVWLVATEPISAGINFSDLPVFINAESRDAGYLTVNVRVNNTSNRAYTSIRAGLIVYDMQQRVIGYRVVEGGPLRISEDISVNISLLPQPVTGDWRYEVYAEGISYAYPDNTNGNRPGPSSDDPGIVG